MTPPAADLIPAGAAEILYEIPLAQTAELVFWLECFGFKVLSQTEIGEVCRLKATTCGCQVCAEGREARLQQALGALAKATADAACKRAERKAPKQSDAGFFAKLREQISKA